MNLTNCGYCEKKMSKENYKNACNIKEGGETFIICDNCIDHGNICFDSCERCQDFHTENDGDHLKGIFYCFDCFMIVEEEEQDESDDDSTWPNKEECERRRIVVNSKT